MSFNKYIENKKIDKSINYCASLLAEMDVDPLLYIYEKLKIKDEVLAEGFWGGVKSFVGTAAQGVKNAWNQAKDTAYGPTAKFNLVVKALNDLKVSLARPEFTAFKSSAYPTKNLADFIDFVIRSIEKDRANMPKMQTVTTQKYAPAGGGPTP